ncbi:MAG: acetolactate synthase [Rhodospirillales bacterium]|nr:acetolactate synthase [Rhodospirillales bacterium]
MTPTAAQALVETLYRHGVDRVFCVPGESYLAALDALYDRPEIQTVACRHEGGAGFMAVADAKMTGRPGIVFVSRAPGAGNAAVAVYTAREDAVPLLLFIGQVPLSDRGMGAFQEVNYDKLFGDIAKSVVEVTDPGQLAPATAEAFRVARSGTPGPVVVAMPEDMLTLPAQAEAIGPLPVARPTPSDAEVSRIAERLVRAERPLLIAGGNVATPKARRALQAASEAWRVPVAVSFKHQDLFINEHPHFAGHLGYGMPSSVVETLGGADLILAVGTRLGEVTTQGFKLPKAPKPDQPLIHVYPDKAWFGRRFETAISVVSGAAPFLEALVARNAPEPPVGRDAWLKQAHAVYAHLAPWEPVTAPDGVSFGHVVAALARSLPEDAILATDAGNFSSWLHRHFPFRSSHMLLGAASGSMGLGVPAAVAAALRFPDRQVAAIVGDGGFLMTGNELATAVQYGARVRLFVSNNKSYGTIRLHQEKLYPGRTIATDLRNPDFASLARAFGAKGLAIRSAADAAPVVAEALASDGPVVVDVATSLQHISAFTTLEKLAAEGAR